MSPARILIVDDEPKMQRVLEIMLRKMGHEVLCAGDGADALALARAEALDLIVTDLRMPVMDGQELLRRLREHEVDTPVIVITAYGTIESAVAAMRHGATDYLIRPFEVDTVELAVTRALAVGQMRSENRYLRAEVEKGWDTFVGTSAPMRAVYDLIRQVAPTPAAVLVVGETGTGKELVAHALHRASGREGLFVPINCAAIPADILESELFGYVKGAFTGALRDRVGKFELADRGTLFLDEITEMAPALQAKLLRVLQESRIERLGSNHASEVDIRVVAATNRDPRAAVTDQRLRADLYYRLNVVTIELPRLRERVEDIPLLAAHFLTKHAGRLGRGAPAISEEALAVLAAQPWPGNVRELENVIERAVVLSAGERIEPYHLPPAAAPAAALAAAPDDAESVALPARVDALERELIERALGRTAGNKAAAARLLRISERSLWYKLKKFGLVAGADDA